MDFNILSENVLREFAGLISEHEGLEIFTKRRAKFEGWVKVELTRILRKYFKEVIPERENRYSRG